jgi:hypothetical protein
MRGDGGIGGVVASCKRTTTALVTEIVWNPVPSPKSCENPCSFTMPSTISATLSAWPQITVAWHTVGSDMFLETDTSSSDTKCGISSTMALRSISAFVRNPTGTPRTSNSTASVTPTGGGRGGKEGTAKGGGGCEGGKAADGCSMRCSIATAAAIRAVAPRRHARMKQTQNTS